MMNTRTVMATWLFAGGVWIAGLVGLSATGICGESVDPMNAAQAPQVYTHTGAWMSYQHPSGKYTISIRAQRRL